MQRLRWTLAGLWLFSLITLASVVTLMFRYAPSPALAGNLAAHLFTAQTWLGVVCVLGLLVLDRQSPNEAIYPLAGVLANLMTEFMAAPHIVARDNLPLWHGVASALYLVQAVCALVYWLRCTRTPTSR